MKREMHAKTARIFANKAPHGKHMVAPSQRAPSISGSRSVHLRCMERRVGQLLRNLWIGVDASGGVIISVKLEQADSRHPQPASEVRS